MTKLRMPVALRLAIALVLAALTPALRAQESKLPFVEQVRVGLPYGSGDPDAGRARPGAWAPVYVKLKAGSQAIAPDSMRLVIESSDGEDAPYQYSTPLPAIDAGADHFAITYARPGSLEIHVSLQSMDGKAIQFQIRGSDGRMANANRLTRDFSHEEFGPQHTVYLALGSRLSGFTRATKENEPPADAAEANQAEERAQRKLSFLEEVRDLPDRWYGYDAADIVVLTTSNQSFVNQLLEAKTARKALSEWVHRGGKLIISAGRNRQLAAKLLEILPLSESDKQSLIECTIDGSITPAKGRSTIPLSVMTRWASVGSEAPPVLELSELTRLRLTASAVAGPAAEPVNVLIREAAIGDEKEGAPVIVHSACGLGRVVLVGFDVDAPPFSTWAGQKTVWEKLELELEPRAAVPKQQDVMRGFQQVSSLGGELKRSLENFQEVPVISFGWVALFILVYIIIVGPLDYLILKKVFKRLELTWITFPTVVMVISVAAYFTAYSLKGSELRINKIDVVDIDLHGTAPQAYGTSWVTLFSPRIQNYTIGVEPAAPNWVETPSTETRTLRPVVTVMEGADTMTPRMGSQSLFRRAYDYAPDAAGLEHVSIPVWSMRTFTARWRAPVAPGSPPVEAALKHSRGENDPVLTGPITNHLPVELRNVSLVYKGLSYFAGTLAPGSTIRAENFKVGDKGKQITQWLTEGTTLSPSSSRTVTGQNLIRDLLFHSRPGQSDMSNAGWRALDQSWRLRPLVEMSASPQPQSVFRDEVMLVARTASQADTSESVTRSDGAPTRLWLDALPGTVPERPSLNGFIVQDVYVRVYIPVNP